jgi:hypothetical protein
MGQQPIPALVLVGGFLGAGKTSLILRAAEFLRLSGRKCAVIMNDQDSGLVDTKYAEAQRFDAQEVAGGCFCCRFSDLMAAAGRLAEFAPEVIFAEPVGSCIDLSATILQPLKAFHSNEYRTAPLTVLVDPDLSARVYANAVDENVSYLFKHQLAEADMVCTTKSDLYGAPPAFPFPVDFRLSARTGAGVEEWLREVLAGNRVVGAKLLDVDYDNYADAEAALGWLNLHAEVHLSKALTPASLAGPLLEELDQMLTAAGATIAHLKIFDRTRTGFVRASICENGGEVTPEGDLMAPSEVRHELVVNLRALADPEELRGVVDAAVAHVPGKVDVKHCGAFRPSPPRPEHRFAERA